MLSIGSSEMLVILVIALVVVGPKRLPEVLRGVAKVYKLVLDAINEAKRELEEDLDEVNVKKDIEEKWREIIEEDDDKDKEKTKEGS